VKIRDTVSGISTSSEQAALQTLLHARPVLHLNFSPIRQGVGRVQNEPVRGGDAAGYFQGGSEIAAEGNIFQVHDVGWEYWGHI
jgi:hypothetical protein